MCTSEYSLGSRTKHKRSTGEFSVSLQVWHKNCKQYRIGCSMALGETKVRGRNTVYFAVDVVPDRDAPPQPKNSASSSTSPIGETLPSSACASTLYFALAHACVRAPGAFRKNTPLTIVLDTQGQTEAVSSDAGPSDWFCTPNSKGKCAACGVTVQYSPSGGMLQCPACLQSGRSSNLQ